MIPNYTMIAEISLFSFGFSEAKVLSETMVATFNLSSEQLSSKITTISACEPNYQVPET
jgi:dynein heavy chain